MAKQPFGEHDCEAEVKKLGVGYSAVFFNRTRFNQAALDPDTYLLVGRRGAGKTALCHYFSFQQDIRNAIYIDVDESEVYARVLAKIGAHAVGGNEDVIAKPADIWEYLLWQLIITECDWRQRGSNGTQTPQNNRPSPAGILDKLIDWMKEKIGISANIDDSSAGLSDQGLTALLTDPAFSMKRNHVLKLASKIPIFLAIDTLEKYNINDAGLMKAMAGLVEAAAKMNLDYAQQGIHIKVFMSGEVFPHLTEVELANPLKSAKQVVYMLWRSKDLLRLIAWRFHYFLNKEGLRAKNTTHDIVWNDPKDVFERAWAPFFGKEVMNRHGVAENSFAYVLRHTQMRPRQLIVLCNAIAVRSLENGNFPAFSRADVVDGIEDGERNLAGEILNSYSQIYPGANEIVRVLSQIPAVFQGNQLDQRASASKKFWKNGEYSQAGFSRLVTELGVVGRVTRMSGGYVDAEFSYAQNYRVDVSHRDTCAIHPMFFRFLNITQPVNPVIVIPFAVSNDDQKWLAK